ncbi:MAG: glycosyltransferase family 4 protein [Bacteroidales bacterium]|nr:glycosyltransferase family 4 protein [Bacteroidales bacterium]
MKIVVTGTRGIPGIQGGVESHCEELYPLLVDENHQVVVVRRKEYISKGYETTEYRGVKIKDISCLRTKHFEAVIHTILAVLYARFTNADIVHIHAIGPSIIVPFARLLGLKVVTTHHGPDYDRQKWGKFSKWILRLGEKWGAKYSNRVIVISKHIKNIINTKYPSQKQVHLIHNGVNLSCTSNSADYLKELGLEKGSYILAVGRFVEEKGFDLLIDAYKNIGCKKKLVIAGGADHESKYSLKLKEMAKENGVILTGFIQKDKLSQLYSNTKLFVLPSYHEGLPIALLEAMNSKADVLVSDIPANAEVGLDKDCYFECGNLKSLEKQLTLKLASESNEVEYDMSKYNWSYIAQQVKDVYDSLM